MSEEALGNNSIQHLKSYVDRVEALESEIKGLNDDKSEIYVDAEEHGFDKKAIKKVISDRRKDPDKLQKENDLYETYWAAYHGADDNQARAHAREETDSEGPAPAAAAAPKAAGKGKGKKAAPPPPANLNDEIQADLETGYTKISPIPEGAPEKAASERTHSPDADPAGRSDGAATSNGAESEAASPTEGEDLLDIPPAFRRTEGAPVGSPPNPDPEEEVLFGGADEEAATT